MNAYKKYLWVLTISVFFTTVVISAPPSSGVVRLHARSGAECVVLPYDFDVKQADFPDLNLPDNALLILAVEGTNFKPEILNVIQNTKVYTPVGVETYYFFGTFHAIYYPVGFNKFKLYELKLGEDSVKITPEQLAGLKGKAKPRGQFGWENIPDETIMSANPLQLPEILARGRGLEYATEALGLRDIGGLALIRAEALKAFELKQYERSACLSAQAIKWSQALEHPDIQGLMNFQDWVTIARAFKAMGEHLAAVRAYDEALKIRQSRQISKEREEAWSAYKKKKGETAPPSQGSAILPFQDGLSEAEYTLAPHGKLPIPHEERNTIREGISANGVFLGDHRDFIIAQCGTPTESFSGMLLFTNHSTCPEVVFISPLWRAYSIRAVRGKTLKGISVGDKMTTVVKAYGQPDRKETNPLPNDKKRATVRWIYLKDKVAFVDFDNDDVIEAIDVFDYSLLK